jgi:hypothetical protein
MKAFAHLPLKVTYKLNKVNSEVQCAFQKIIGYLQKYD